MMQPNRKRNDTAKDQAASNEQTMMQPTLTEQTNDTTKNAAYHAANDSDNLSKRQQQQQCSQRTQSTKNHRQRYHKICLGKNATINQNVFHVASEYTTNNGSKYSEPWH